MAVAVASRCGRAVSPLCTDSTWGLLVKSSRLAVPWHRQHVSCLWQMLLYWSV